LGAHLRCADWTSSDIRRFYVGETRAREKLYICGRESNIAVTI